MKQDCTRSFKEYLKRTQNTLQDNSEISETFSQTPHYGLIDDITVIWFDSNMDESNDEYQRSICQLQCIVSSIQAFHRDEDSSSFFEMSKVRKSS